MSANGRIRFRFGDFDLFPAEGWLRKGEEQVHLSLKAFEVLALLVERHGTLVEKSELIERVWKDTFVEEAAVSRCVWAVRNALGEDSKSPTYIQTVPKRGYRFIGDVETVREGLREAGKNGYSGEQIDKVEPFGFPVTSMSSGRQTAPQYAVSTAKEIVRDTVVPFRAAEDVSEDAPRFRPVLVRTGKTRNRFAALSAAFLLVCVIAATAFLLLRASQPIATTRVKIAILPLKPVDGTTRNFPPEFAIAEALILKMNRSRQFDVKPLSAIRKFVDLETDPVEAGHELKVDYVLSTNYQVAASRMRVTAQLFAIRTGSVESTFVAEGNVDDLFSLQDGISNEIGNSIMTALGGTTDEFRPSRGTTEPKAYALFQEAQYLVDKLNREDSAKAGIVLDQALAIDPWFAEAWALKAHAYCQFAHTGGASPSELIQIAEPALNRAISMNENISLAYGVRGTLNRDYYWNFSQAYIDLERALKLDPTSQFAYRVLSGLCIRDGRFVESRKAAEKALDLNPTALVERVFVAESFFFERKYDKAIEAYLNVIASNPGWSLPYFGLWRSYHMRGEEENAFNALVKGQEYGGDGSHTNTAFRSIYASRGWNGVLRHQLDALLRSDVRGSYSP
ncbi:MAG TPA: winged helix-turn-helix domain-containing protein, partial [Pyrinomonadaceae bacterium]